MPAPAVAEMSVVRATIVDVPRWDDAPLVGRADELARLLAHVERAEAGRSTAVLLAGDAGVGKTRLLDELTARATGRGVRVLIGHCVDLGDTPPAPSPSWRCQTFASHLEVESESEMNSYLVIVSVRIVDQTRTREEIYPGLESCDDATMHLSG